jgi:hypothetical protein
MLQQLRPQNGAAQKSAQRWIAIARENKHFAD